MTDTGEEGAADLDVIPSKERHQITEWQEAMRTGRHFNDLLIRLRGIALPVLVAAGGLVTTVDLDLTVRVALAVPVGAFFFVAGLLALLLWKWVKGVEGTDTNGEPQSDSRKFERRAYWLLVAALVAFPAAALIRWWRDERAVSTVELGIESFLVFVAAVMVSAVYILDRYYYFRLLIGAVRRATLLEKHIGFRLTRTITHETDPAKASVAVTALYGIPVAIGVLVAGVLLWLSVDPGSAR